MRLLGLVPVAIGASARPRPAPDLLITGDGRHLAVVGPDGTPQILRDRAGDYVRSLLAEASGSTATRTCWRSAVQRLLAATRASRSSAQGRPNWRLLATRSAYRIDWASDHRACADADIVVSDRRLPRGCKPRWLKLDPEALARTGGLAIYLGSHPRVDSVAERVGAHPGRRPGLEPVRAQIPRRISPASRPWIWTRRGS